MFWFCINYRDYKDVFKGYIDFFCSLFILSFIKECGLKKGYFGKVDVILFWLVRED